MATAKRARNFYDKQLAALAKRVAKAKPKGLHAALYEVFVTFAAAADVPRASTVLDWMYGPRTPAPTAAATALSTGAIDLFCAAAGLGDRTNGVPEAGGAPLGERVVAHERAVRVRVTSNAYLGEPPTDDDWASREGAWRQIDRWRRIQSLASAGDDAGALERLVGYLGDLDASARGAGYGNELALGLDIALRLGRKDLATAWVARHGHRFASESFLLETALSFRSVAAAICEGLLAGVVDLDELARGNALSAIDAALTLATTAAAAPPKPIPRIQKRRAGADYSQVHLEPNELDADELGQVHFQRPEDTDRGMSVFPTRVGIGTPTETAYVDAEITLGGSTSLAGVVRAVAFPLDVRGPLALRSPTGGDDEDPFDVPPGRYDVLARFTPKKAPRSEREAGLRVFALALSFHPRDSLGAPKTILLEEE